MNAMKSVIVKYLSLELKENNIKKLKESETNLYLSDMEKGKERLQPSVEKNAIHLFSSDSAKGMLH